MYDAVQDIYCYTGTTVLKNLLDIHEQESLDEFEAAITFQRSDEALPDGDFDVVHFCSIHHHLFQDVYAWAGTFRMVRISKDKSAFCYPENIEREMKILFDTLLSQNYFGGLSVDEFVIRVAHFLSTLNAIHPFREGNGRTQMSFLLLLADRAGHPLNLRKLVPSRFMDAMISSFEKDENQLSEEIMRLMDGSTK